MPLHINIKLFETKREALILSVYPMIVLRYDKSNRFIDLCLDSEFLFFDEV